MRKYSDLILLNDDPTNLLRGIKEEEEEGKKQDGLEGSKVNGMEGSKVEITSADYKNTRFSQIIPLSV